MTILRDVLSELIGMFLGDARLSAAILAVVAAAAAVIDLAGASPLVGGLVLLVGCPAVMVGAVLRAARRRAVALADTGADR
jgi:hypothetical protein